MSHINLKEAVTRLTVAHVTVQAHLETCKECRRYALSVHGRLSAKKLTAKERNERSATIRYALSKTPATVRSERAKAAWETKRKNKINEDNQ